jgi:hypothetical protein
LGKELKQTALFLYAEFVELKSTSLKGHVSLPSKILPSTGVHTALYSYYIKALLFLLFILFSLWQKLLVVDIFQQVMTTTGKFLLKGFLLPVGRQGKLLSLDSHT